MKKKSINIMVFIIKELYVSLVIKIYKIVKGMLKFVEEGLYIYINSLYFFCKVRLIMYELEYNI